MEKKPGRNDPCPCGSGKKYKQCCMGKENQVKKTYTPSGKRKFKATVLSSGLGKSKSVFEGSAYASPTPTEPLKMKFSKFKMTDADYTVKEGEEKKSEHYVSPESETAKKPEPRIPTFKPGEDFKPSGEDYRQDADKQE